MNNNFECDCTGTFYRGKICEKGIIVVPEVPILSINQTKFNLKIQGHPDNHVIVSLIPSPDVLIEPTKVRLTKNKTSGFFAITARKYGFLSIKYNISGANAAEFYKPESTVLFVDEANKTNIAPICYSCGGNLAKGCFMKILDKKSFTSNVPWSSSKKTLGTTQIIAYENKALPLSLIGGQILPSGLIETYTVENEFEVKNTINFISNCSKKGEELFNIGYILRTHAFEYSIQVFFNTYSPSWFKVIAALKINEYYKKDLYAEIYMGSELQKKSDKCIGGVTFKSDNTYYIHQTNQIYNILLPQNFIELPNFCTKCFIVNLNDKRIYFGFSHNKEVNMESGQIYNNILQRFSDDLSSLIGFQVISSSTLFDMVGSSQMLMFMGKRNYNVTSEDLKVGVIAEGEISFNSGENYSGYKEMNLGEGSFVDFTITTTVTAKAQSMKINGLSSGVNSYQERKSNKIAKVSATVFPVRNILQTKDLSNVFTFSKLSPVSLSITYNLAIKTFEEKETKSHILIQVNKAKEIVSATISFLKRLSVNEYIQDNLESLQNSMRNLLKALLSYSNNDESAFRNIEVIRLLFSEELKKFSVLLHQYVQSNPLDNVGMELKFLKFKNQFDEFIRNTNLNDRQQYDVDEMSNITIKDKGQLCVEHFGFTHLVLVIDFYQKKVVGQFISEDNIGNYIKIFPLSKIYYDLTNRTKHSSLKGEVVVFNQVKEIDILIQNSVLSFNVDARIGNMENLVPLHVEASLDAVLRDDPLYFVFSGNMEKSNQIKNDIKGALQDYFIKLEKSLNSRQALIISSQLSAQRLLTEVNNEILQVKIKIQQLKNQLDSVNANLTRLETLLNSQKEAYKQAIKQYSNATSNQVQTLVEQCQPKLCNSSCIPGLKKKICNTQKKILLVNQQCHLENLTTVVYQHVKVNRSALTTEYEKKTDCWSKCPPLKNI